ncbi:MAG: SpoIIE family protein phosphatase [Rhodospirillales bacterium]|nr:SpoIIE family protein phosphatase [Rhodospirillales bacterium]
MNRDRPGAPVIEDDIPPIDNCRILVIDDNLLICKLIRTRLEMEGIAHIELAHDGRQGLEKLDSFAPDLVILDIQMPIIDGREVLRLMRAKPKYQNLPVIVESALEGNAEREELVEMGATNIIAKSINHNLLAMLVRVHLEHQLLVKNLRDYRKRLSQELDLARDMQAELLPSPADIKLIAKKHGLRIESTYQPCSELGGDFWSIRSLDDHRLALLMIDFAGHGIGASINTFRLNMILGNLSPLGKTPAQFLARLNGELCRLLRPTEFATAFFGILDTRNHTFDYAAAGSPPPVAAHSNSRDIVIGDSRGIPLGISPTARYEQRHMDFTPATTIILFSDAFPEARCGDGRPVGIDGMRQLIAAGFDDPCTAPKLGPLLKRFTAMVKGPPDDDMTLLCLQSGF